jgi:hypothetical protein
MAASNMPQAMNPSLNFARVLLLKGLICQWHIRCNNETSVVCRRRRLRIVREKLPEAVRWLHSCYACGGSKPPPYRVSLTHDKLQI